MSYQLDEAHIWLHMQVLPLHLPCMIAFYEVGAFFKRMCNGGYGESRTHDLFITSELLCQLSYAAMASRKGLEPSASRVTGARSNHLSYRNISKNGLSHLHYHSVCIHKPVKRLRPPRLPIYRQWI